MLLDASIPFSLPMLLVDVAMTPNEYSKSRLDRVVTAYGQDVGYEFAVYGMSNSSPLADSDLWLLPSNKFMGDFSAS